MKQKKKRWYRLLVGLILLMVGFFVGVKQANSHISKKTEKSKGNTTTQPLQSSAINFAFDKTIDQYIIVNFGDSIFGSIEDETSISQVIADNTDAKVINVGFSGTRGASTDEKHLYEAFSFTSIISEIVKAETDQTKWQQQDQILAQQKQVASHYTNHLAALKKIDLNQVDLITIAYGTNDFTKGVPVHGKEVTTFEGALNQGITQLLTSYPNLEIVLCSQIYRFWEAESGVFLDDANSHVLHGQKLTDFRQQTEEIAKRYGLLFIDTYLLFDEINYSAYFNPGDGIHPNELGRKVIGESISRELIRQSHQKQVY